MSRQDIVNASMNSLQRSTILLVSVVVFCIAALLISFIIQKGRTNLRKKDTEILYRDELFQKLSMNVDDVFLMLDVKTYQADYVSPNAEKLLGITAEQIRKDICVLGKLHPENSEMRRRIIWRRSRFMSRRNGILNIFIRKQGKNAGSIILQCAVR